MQNRTPVARPARPALPDFAPVPRKYRHDGWTPDRQKAFIEALADTGSVSRAAAMVNMAQANCYTLRRAPGAEEFRKAWEAALDFGLQRLKDVAFERAIEGQLVPVFVGGKLVGFRRMRNDALLMFCLRHYGQDSAGRRTTVNYFSTRADAAAGRSGAGAGAGASVTTMRTVTAGARAAALEDGRGQALAAEIDEFAGVALDTQAQASIAAALEACASRARAAGDAVGERALDLAEDDPDESFVAVSERGQWFRGGLIPGELEEATTFGGDEVPWTMAGAEKPMHDWVAPGEAAAVGVLAPPDDGGVAAVKPRPSRRRRADASSGSGPA